MYLKIHEYSQTLMIFTLSIAIFYYQQTNYTVIYDNLKLEPKHGYSLYPNNTESHVVSIKRTKLQFSINNTILAKMKTKK